MMMSHLPQCPPFGDFVQFVFDDRVEVVTSSHALTSLIVPAASLVDSLAEEVEQPGITVWKFTYLPPLWERLCTLLGELYSPTLPLSVRLGKAVTYGD